MERQIDILSNALYRIAYESSDRKSRNDAVNALADASDVIFPTHTGDGPVGIVAGVIDV